MQLILTSSCNLVLEDILNKIDLKPSKAKLLFIPTAAEGESGDLSWLEADRQQLVDAGFSLKDFTLTGKKEAAVKKALSGVDGVFVSGGNTFFLLQEINRSGFRQLIKEKQTQPLFYIGSSAGTVVAGSDIYFARHLDDPKAAPELTKTEGLNLIDACLLPHWGSEQFRQRYWLTFQHMYTIGSTHITLTDQQYLLAKDNYYKVETKSD